MSETTETPVVGAVHRAIFKILGELSVEKNGTLPSNLGGKPYIAAVDLFSEVKRKLVENNLIVIPFSREKSKQVVEAANGRLTVATTTEGEYTLFSIEDGSTALIGDTGDGLAIGSAVASNISSTNAMKNALLRTFLVSEQSTEDAAKAGIESPERVPAKSAGPTLADQLQVIKGWITTAGIEDEKGELIPLTATEVNAVGARVTGDETGKKWKTDVAQVTKVIDALKAGARK